MDFNHGVCVYGRQKLFEKQSTLNFKRLQGLHGTESSQFQGNNLNRKNLGNICRNSKDAGIFPEFSCITTWFFVDFCHPDSHYRIDPDSRITTDLTWSFGFASKHLSVWSRRRNFRKPLKGLRKPNRSISNNLTSHETQETPFGKKIPQVYSVRDVYKKMF